MIVDGRALAADIYRGLCDCSGMTLGILVGADDPATRSFVRIKEKSAALLGINIVHRDVPPESSTESVIMALRDLAATTDGIIVQLPLASAVDSETVLASIPLEKDIDGINPAIPYDHKRAFPPVALAVMHILEHAGVVLPGMKTVVIGAGRLVGAPSAYLLEKVGARVVVVTKEEGTLDELKDADVIVSGAGVAGLIRADMIRDGVVLIDAGTSNPPAGAGGTVAGDADPACTEKCSVFTPVPGGVGPVAVAMIFKNVRALARGR